MRNFTTNHKFLVVCLSFLIFTACKHEPEVIPGKEPGNTNNPVEVVTCDPDTVYFENDILPILSSCGTSGCHDNETQEEGIILTNYATIMASGVIQPGDPSESELYEAITETDPEDRMPYNMPALPSDQIAMIRKWIQQGAKNNYCQTDCDTTIFTFSGAIEPLMNKNCKSCHNANLANGGVRLDSYPEIAKVANDGRLLNAVSYNYTIDMPPSGKLPDCRITQIKKWIAAGAANN